MGGPMVRGQRPPAVMLELGLLAFLALTAIGGGLQMLLSSLAGRLAARFARLLLVDGGGHVPSGRQVTAEIRRFLAATTGRLGVPLTDSGSGEHLTRRERVGLLAHRLLDKWLTPIGVWLLRRTKGGLAKPWKADVLLLTTHGRRSGRERTVVLQYFSDGTTMVVMAANDGGDAYPGWYHNLKADPAAGIEVDGRRIAVRAEELPADEAAGWWSRIVERDPSYARFRRATSRPFPILRLVSVASVGAPEAPGGVSRSAR